MLVRRTATIGPCEPCPCQPATCCCYVFLLVTVGLQSLGIPLPGETALVTAAALAALGRLSIYGVVAAAAAGAILGDNAGYWIGRKGASRWFRANRAAVVDWTSGPVRRGVGRLYCALPFGVK